MTEAIRSPYSQIAESLYNHAQEASLPLEGSFEITRRCNLSCGMCYVRECSSDASAALRELSAAQWVDLARQAADCGMLFLLITGGEPLFRNDFFEIYEPLTELGLHLILFTNGTLVTRDFAKRLAKRPPFRLEVSLYGASPQTYERITGSSTAFAKTCAGIEALLAAGIPLLVKTTLCKYNLHELPVMREMARKWNVVYSPAWLLTRRRDKSASAVDDFRLSAEQIAALQTTEGVEAWSAEDYVHAPTVTEKRTCLACGAGRSSFVIDSEGTLIPCMDLPDLRGYPLEVGFHQALAEMLEQIELLPVSELCGGGTCDLNSDCPWCPAASYLENGTYTDRVPYSCSIAAATRGARIVSR